MVLMNKRGILPVKVIELQINAREMLHRSEREKEGLPSFSQLPYHNRLVKSTY